MMKIVTHLCLLPKPLHHLLQPSLALHKLLSNLNKERFNFEDALLFGPSLLEHFVQAILNHNF